MKKLILFSLLLLVATLMGCRRNRTVQYVRVAVDSAAIAAEDVPTAEDEARKAMEEGIVELPDIPQESDIDYNANSYELERIMSGKGD